MTDQDDEQQNNPFEEPVTQERREFLRSLGKWSQAVIGGVVLGGAVTTSQQARASWYNRGGGWYNRGGGWYNRGGGWANRSGGGWFNRGGGWHNRGGGWFNRGGGWHNRGGGWFNRGGGGWSNR
nr:hypothetical protein [Candidatus Contendobacter sp.]